MKKNHKGVMLIEAIIAGGILAVTLVFSAYLLSANTRTREISLESINLLSIERLQNHIEYMKAKLEDQGDTTQFWRQNLIYAGWDTLSITPNGQSINELNGMYYLETDATVCAPSDVSDSGYPACLVQVTNPDQWGFFVLGGSTYRKYTEATDGKLVLAEEENMTSSECDEISSYCFLYRISITNPTRDYDTIEYTEASGNPRTIIPQKHLKIEMLQKEPGGGTPKKVYFDYILSL